MDAHECECARMRTNAPISDAIAVDVLSLTTTCSKPALTVLFDLPSTPPKRSQVAADILSGRSRSALGALLTCPKRATNVAETLSTTCCSTNERPVDGTDIPLTSPLTCTTADKTP